MVIEMPPSKALFSLLTISRVDAQSAPSVDVLCIVALHSRIEYLAGDSAL